MRDKAGNLTEAPLPTPTAAAARPGTGVSVRNFTLRGPLSAVTAGGLARLEVGPVDRDFDFAVSRLGDPKPLLHGGRVAGRFRIHVPSKMRTGVYVVRVRARGDRAVWPLAVAGLPPRSARGGARPLVVLPALTWQGLNTVDDDADGFADRLPFSHAVQPRPAVRGRRHAAALRRRGVAPAALARPRAAVRTTSPPTSRWRATRARRSATRPASRSPAASCGFRTSS